MSRPRTLGSVFHRTWREQRRALWGWSGGITALCVVMLSIYPTVHGNKIFHDLMKAYPEALRKIFNITDYTSGSGYLRAEVFSFMAPLLLSIFAILWGSDLIAGEEERRTIDLLLATPVTRGRILAEKWGALALGTALLSAILELVLGLAGPLFRLHIGWSLLSAEVIGSGLFALFCGTCALALGAATGSRGLSRGVVAAIAVLMYLLSTLSAIVPWLRSVKWLSIWSHAMGAESAESAIRWDHLTVVILVIAATFGVGLALFQRRDVAT